MIVKRHMLRRLGRAGPKKVGGVTLAELLRAVPDAPVVETERARRAAEAAAAAEKAALPPQPAEATPPPPEARPTDPLPPAPGMPPPEPKWYDGMCRWRPRDASDSYDDVYYSETIHEYDPLAYLDEEEEEEYGSDD